MWADANLSARCSSLTSPVRSAHAHTKQNSLQDTCARGYAHSVQAGVVRTGSMTPAARSFTPVVLHQRRLAGIVRVAAAQNEPEPKPDSKPSKKPGKLWSEELFERCRRLEADGMSREAAETMVTTTQFMTEWTIEGPIGKLDQDIGNLDRKLDQKIGNLNQKIEALYDKVKAQGGRQNVVIGLLVLVLCSRDVTKLENSIIGAAVKFLLKL